VQVDPIQPKSKPPGTKRLKLEYDGLLSNFGFKGNLRRYTVELLSRVNAALGTGVTTKLVVADGQGLTLVPTSAQLELTLPCSAQLKLTLSPMQPKLNCGCVPKALKLSADVSDVSRRSSS